MLAVDIRIGHQNDLVIPSLLGVEIFANTGTECRDHGLNFGVAERTIEARLFYIEDLSSQRKDRLELGVAALNGRTTGRVTLNHEDLRERGVFARAVTQLSGHSARLEQALTASLLASLASSESCLGCLNSLADNIARLCGVAIEPVTELLTGDALNESLRFSVAQLGLGLALELRFTSSPERFSSFSLMMFFSRA